VQFLRVEAPYVSGVEVFELEAPEDRDYVRVNLVLVNFLGADAYRTPHRILQPAYEVLSDRDAPRVED